MHQQARTPVKITAILASAALLLSGCTPDKPEELPSPEVTATDGAAMPAMLPADAAEASLVTATTLFSRANEVVLAPVGEGGDADDNRTAAAGLARHLRLPLLLVGDDAAPALQAMQQLGTTEAISFGVDHLGDGASASAGDGASRGSAPRVLPLTAATDLTKLLPESPQTQPVETPDLLAQLANAPGEPGDLLTANLDGGSLKAETPNVKLPKPAAAAETAKGLRVVVDEADARYAAAVANARTAGAEVGLYAPTPGTADPIEDPALLAAAGVTAPGATAAPAPSSPPRLAFLAPALASSPDAAWKIGVLAKGVHAPGSPSWKAIDGTLHVALYGHPGDGVLGLLGEQGIDATIARTKEYAAKYAPLTDRRVVPTLEIITTVASGAAGPDGDYSVEMSPDDLQPWIDAAAAADMPVILDLQPGRTDFLTQAKRYEAALKQPNVSLALDPEWRLGPNDHHLETIGSVSADEVNQVGDWLAGLTRDNGLPQKMFILHQFRLDMVQHRDAVNVSHPELAPVVHVDGQGGQGAKQGTWRTLHDGANPAFAWGWKNFIDEDKPMLTPEQTMSEVDPTPDLITYQ